MRHWCALLPVLLLAVLAAADKQKTYTTKYDNVDVDSILGNNRILSNYIKCMLDEGPCTPDGRELKSEYFQRNIALSLRNSMLSRVRFDRGSARAFK
jgi:hypothetical protein